MFYRFFLTNKTQYRTALFVKQQHVCASDFQGAVMYAFVGRGGQVRRARGDGFKNLWANYAKPAVSFLFRIIL